MSPALPNPEPDPRLSLEAIEAQLRALPPASVPAGLAGKLISGIPPAAAGAAASTIAVKLWALWAGMIAAGAVIVGLSFYWLSGEKPVAPNAKENVNQNAPVGNSDAATIAQALQKEIQRLEETTRVDPFDANAWFSLAKAQLQAQRKADAVSSAEKALDVARSGRRRDLVAPVEAWLRANTK